MTFGYWLNNSILPIIENIKNWIIQVSNFLINNWIFKIIIYLSTNNSFDLIIKTFTNALNCTQICLAY